MVKLHENENIILQKRRHWYVVASESALLAVVALIPLLVILVSGTSPAVEAAISQLLPLVVFSYSAFLLLLWIIFFVFWTNYYLDVLVITNKRIIDIEQHGLFARDIVEVKIDHIQDVKVEVIGMLPSLLNFGDLHIQTAGQQREVTIDRIAHPDDVRQAISKQQHN